MPDTSPQTNDNVPADVNAIFQGMTNAVMARQQQQRDQRDALPPNLNPSYQPPLPTALAPQQASNIPTATPPQQSPAPWATPPNYTVGSVRPGDPGYVAPQQQQPTIQQPQPIQQPPAQPRQDPGHGSERAPFNSMPRLWDGDRRGPSGRTKQEFLTGRMMHESQGDPTALNYVARRNPSMYDAGYTASGLLQDVNTTWNNGVQWAMADPDRYPMSADPRQFKTAREAPWDVQWQVNSAIYDHAGESPWRDQGGQGGFRGSPNLRNVVDSYQQPTQQFAPAQPRDFGQWGREAPGFGSSRPGEMPRQSDFGRIMTGMAPLLLGIASLALRLPLSTAVTAYGAMARAQQNGQNLEYERNRTKFQDQLKEATAQQTLESREASDAFEQYGNNNPEGLQQELARVALKYNDPTMFRLAESGDLNRIYQLQQRRDQLNQGLTKTSKALEDQQDRQAQDAAVTAMDHKWHDQFVQDNGREPTADETAIAHNEHIGEAGRAGTKDPKTGGTGSSVEAPLYDVVDKDGKPTGKQVRLGKNGGYVDAATNQPFTPEPGETVQEAPRRKEGGAGSGEKMEGPVYDVVDKDGKPTGKQVRAGVNGGLFDAATREPVTLGPGERVQQTPRQGTSGAGSGEGMALYDVVGADGNPTGKQVRLGKSGGMFDAKTSQPATLEEGETVRPVSRQAQPRAAPTLPDSWKGAPYQPPPNVDAGLWQQAINWAEQGRPPVGLGGRASSMYQQVEPLVPAAMKALGIQSLSEQSLKYSARQHALNAVETGFGSGVNGRNLISLNTVAEHINLFRQYADALKNGDVQKINQLKNRLATEAGSPEVIDFALAGRITGDEVVRLLTTTGGTLADREDIASRLASYDSPDQFEGAANTLTNYVRGRYGPLRQAYARGDPEREKYFDNNMVTPEARQLFQAPQRPIPGSDQPDQPAPQPKPSATPPAWADPQGKPAYLNGRTIWHKPDGKWYFDDQSLVPGQ